MLDGDEGRQGAAAPGGNEESELDYVNADDLFYWMEEPCGADIPLCALWIHVPTGCRFCC